MTKIPLNLKNDQILPKPKNWPEYPLNLKMTKIILKPKKNTPKPKIPPKPKK